jgi:hypothetical protein
VGGADVGREGEGLLSLRAWVGVSAAMGKGGSRAQLRLGETIHTMFGCDI